MSETVEKHPKGLYVLFATEMWERFSFYTMNGMLVLYMINASQGFGWSNAKATTINSWYLAFVYFTPLMGGLIADKLIGFRRAITIGGLFFMAGHLLLAVPGSVPVFFSALVCLVIGNGFFKPNVSSLVGNLYKEGSHLKDRAYLIFYMGINVGAALAPIVAEYTRNTFGFHPAFAVAAGGMVISLIVFWSNGKHVAYADRRGGDFVKEEPVRGHVDAVAVTEDLPPTTGGGEHAAMAAVPEWKRIVALVVIFVIVIVFWMVFHQNSSTLTLWAHDNTEWKVTGILSNAINPIWIILLSLPLAWFWSFLDRRGMEPSTPAKMAIGMTFTGASFIVLYFAAQAGGYDKPAFKVAQQTSGTEAWVTISDEAKEHLKISATPTEIEIPSGEKDGKTLRTMAYQARNIDSAPIGGRDLCRFEGVEGNTILVSPARRVSPVWLILAYMVLSLGELMLSPMGLALVSKVAPPRMRGLMMGGWFAATAIGNKLTAIGNYWDLWSHAKFFVVLACMAFAMAVVLLLLIRPLKKAMPGV